MNKLLNHQEQKEMFQQMADELNKIAKDHNIPPSVVGNMFARMMGSPVRFK